MDELPGGLLRVTMPLPTRPGHVHCYLAARSTAATCSSTPGSACPTRRSGGRPSSRSSTRPVVTIFLTHFHPDHLGAAADVRELTGARVYQGRVDAAQARLVWENDGVVASVLADWFHRNGVPERSPRS